MIKVKLDTEDKQVNKFMEELINYEYNRNKKFIDAVTRARFFLEMSFGVSTPDDLWSDIMQAHVEQELEKQNEINDD